MTYKDSRTWDSCKCGKGETKIACGWHWGTSIERRSMKKTEGHTKHRLTIGRSSYFTDRPLSTTVVLEHVASRQWMTMTEWTYPLGDGKAVGGHELTGIASKVYESMMRTRVDSRVSPSSFDFETFQKDMDDFNNRIAAWGDYWQATFATCKIVSTSGVWRTMPNIIQFPTRSLSKNL